MSECSASSPVTRIKCWTNLNTPIKKPVHKPKTTFSMEYGLRIETWKVCTLLGISKPTQLCRSFNNCFYNRSQMARRGKIFYL